MIGGGAQEVNRYFLIRDMVIRQVIASRRQSGYYSRRLPRLIDGWHSENLELVSELALP